MLNVNVEVEVEIEIEIEIEVTLRPTVSQPVRLGVLSPLEQVTRCYIYLSDNKKKLNSMV
jgi:hypothetical protein